MDGGESANPAPAPVLMGLLGREGREVGCCTSRIVLLAAESAMAMKVVQSPTGLLMGEPFLQSSRIRMGVVVFWSLQLRHFPWGSLYLFLTNWFAWAELVLP